MDYVITVTPLPCAVVLLGLFRGRVNACFMRISTTYAFVLIMTRNAIAEFNQDW